MGNAPRRHWHRWRITTAKPAQASRSGRPRAARHDEQPGPDGIRHGLVARIKAEIAAGTYDTEERWIAAEAALIRRVEERM